MNEYDRAAAQAMAELPGLGTPLEWAMASLMAETKARFFRDVSRAIAQSSVLYAPQNTENC